MAYELVATTEEAKNWQMVKEGILEMVVSVNNLGYTHTYINEKGEIWRDTIVYEEER